MAGRIRSIKPELLDDEKTASLSDAAFRMFIGLLLLCDDYGNVRGNVKWLQSQIWWAREPSSDKPLDELLRSGVVFQYTVNEQTYLAIRNWAKHQKVDHAGVPRVPGPEHVAPCRTDSRESLESLGMFPESLATDLRSPISDLRSGSPTPVKSQTDATAPVSQVVGEEPRKEGFPLQVQTPDPKKPKQRKLRLVQDPTTVQVGWQLWTTTYETSSRSYGVYTRGPSDGAVMKRLAAMASDEVRRELERRGGESPEPEAEMVRSLLAHWFLSFIRDEGHNGTLVSFRHPLRCIERDIPKYGTPWSKMHVRKATAEELSLLGLRKGATNG